MQVVIPFHSNDHLEQTIGLLNDVYIKFNILGHKAIYSLQDFQILLERPDKHRL